MVPRPRAYSSCPPDSGCLNRPVLAKDLVVINPFLWPYSGTHIPQIIIENKKMPASFANNTDLSKEIDSVKN
jgi:hypothetical protein